MGSKKKNGTCFKVHTKHSVCRESSYYYTVVVSERGIHYFVGVYM